MEESRRERVFKPVTIDLCKRLLACFVDLDGGEHEPVFRHIGGAAHVAVELNQAPKCLFLKGDASSRIYVEVLQAVQKFRLRFVASSLSCQAGSDQAASHRDAPMIYPERFREQLRCAGAQITRFFIAALVGGDGRPPPRQDRKG